EPVMQFHGHAVGTDQAMSNVGPSVRKYLLWGKIMHQRLGSFDPASNKFWPLLSCCHSDFAKGAAVRLALPHFTCAPRPHARPCVTMVSKWARVTSSAS